MNKESESSQDIQGEDLRHSKCSNLPILIQVMQQQSQKTQAWGLLSFHSLSNCRLWESLINSFFSGACESAAKACYVTRARKKPTLSVPQPSAAQFMSNLQTFNIAASQFIKSNSARAKSLGNGFRITRGVTGSSWWVTFLLTKVPFAKWVPGLTPPSLHSLFFSLFFFFLAALFWMGREGERRWHRTFY